MTKSGFDPMRDEFGTTIPAGQPLVFRLFKTYSTYLVMIVVQYKYICISFYVTLDVNVWSILT